MTEQETRVSVNGIFSSGTRLPHTLFQQLSLPFRASKVGVCKTKVKDSEVSLSFYTA